MRDRTINPPPLVYQPRFDDRSRSYRVPIPKKPELRSKTWKRTVPPLDQGSLGCCTGAAAVGVLATAPNYRPTGRYTLTTAKNIYARATQIDAFRGTWPPTDTGSSVLAAMKAMKALDLVRGYSWCFGLSDVLGALSLVGPVEVGTKWYSGFNSPDRRGLVRIGGAVEGGHAYQLVGIDVPARLVWAVNSWGSSWGANGRFCMSWDDLGVLLSEQGEASTVLV